MVTGSCGYSPTLMLVQVTDQYNNMLESVHVPHHAKRLYSIKELMGFKKYYQFKYDIVNELDDIKEECKINNTINISKLKELNELIQGSIFENKIKWAMDKCMKAIENDNKIMIMNHMYDVKFYISKSKLIIGNDGLSMVAIWI